MLDFKVHCNWSWYSAPIIWMFAGGALLLSGCTTYGTIYVGQPQVHTRDRLVAERHDEAAWLRTKLKAENLEQVGNHVDGYRDLRVFTGLFASLKADLDPAGAAKKSLDSDTAEAEAEAAYWEAKAKAKAAKDAYEKPKAEVDTKDETQPPGTEFVNTATTDVTTTEYLRDSDGKLAKDPDENYLITKVVTVDESTNKVPLDHGEDSETVAEATAAAKTAAAEEVAKVKETADAALAKATEAEGKLDKAIEAAASGRFPEADVKNALAAADPSKSKVTPSPLNKLHDQMAYRDTIDAALRQVELDDAHDLAGRQLYELTLGATVVPGDNSTQYAQVGLSLSPLKTGNDRRVEIENLFYRWISTLETTLYEETYGLLKRNKIGKLTHEDEEFIDWFLQSGAPVVEMDLNRRINTLSALQGGTITLDKLADAEIAGDILPFATHIKNNLIIDITEKGVKSQATSMESLLKIAKTNISQVTVAFNSMELGDTPSQNVRAIAIPWAVWAKYRNELYDIVEIAPPTFDSNDFTGGFKVTPVPGIRIYNKGDKRDDNSKCKNVAEIEITSSQPSFRQTGICAFTRRIMKAEEHPITITASPKEAAQNVSEVAAREQMLELMLHLTAATADLKANGTLDTEFIKRRKEQVHALTRKPQVIGFGQGGERFGWLLGPRFGVTEDGNPVWRHEAVRHDVSAAVVVPGWWRYMHVEGIYSWVDDEGETTQRECIWGGEVKEENGKFRCEKVEGVKPYVSISLPMPSEPMAEITRALVAPAGARNRYSVFADRRPPAIYEVVAGVKQGDEQSVTAGAKVSLLIHGLNLWRSPQVFLGSLEADHVKVLSDMDALLATFNSLPYPGTIVQKNASMGVSQQVTVLTAFGRDQSKDDNKVLVYPGAKLSAPAQKVTGSLSTRMSTGANPVITFIIPKAEQTAGVMKLRVREKGQTNWTDPPDDKVSLELVGDMVRFTLTRPAETKVMEVAVVRLANNATDISNGTAMLEKPATLALFKDEAATKGTLKPETLELKKDDGSYSGGELTISFKGRSNNDPLFTVLSAAYNGWDSSFPAGGSGKAKVLLYETFSDNAVITLTAMCKRDNNQRVCAIKPEELDKKLKGKKLKLRDEYNVQLVLDGKNGAKVPVNKVVKIKKK